MSKKKSEAPSFDWGKFLNAPSHQSHANRATSQAQPATSPNKPRIMSGIQARRDHRRRSEKDAFNNM